MIKISILYPNTGRFDMDYYLNTHMPHSIESLGKGKGYRGVSVERGLAKNTLLSYRQDLTQLQA